MKKKKINKWIAQGTIKEFNNWKKKKAYSCKEKYKYPFAKKYNSFIKQWKNIIWLNKSKINQFSLNTS